MKKMQRAFLLLSLGLLVITACTLPGLTPPPPTDTPGPSPTPTTAPTLTPTPTPSPTPTPIPAVRLSAGDRALANGDYTHAHDEYQIALASSSDETVRAAALWGLGKSDFLHENYPSALDSLRSLVQNYPQSGQVARAYFLLGETYFDLKRYQEAAGAYASYLQLSPGLLDAYAQERRGDALSATANYSEALDAYQAALQADGQSSPTAIKVKIAGTYVDSGDPTTALTMYDEIFAATGNDYLKAQMDFLSGQALIKLGRTEDAYARWNHAVENYPRSSHAYLALFNLVDADQPVDDFNRGVVDYFAGQYGVALDRLKLYITAHPDHDGTALFYEGLTQFYLGNYEDEVQTWTKFIQNYPANRYWATAVDGDFTTDPARPVPGIAYTQWGYLDQYSAAAQTLKDAAATASGLPFAVPFLMDAARIDERAGKLDEAATLWESLPDKFPSDGSFGEATFQGGIIRYRQGNYPQALQDFKSSLSLAADSTERARAQLWIGKTYQAAGDSASAESAWQQAQAVDAVGYYSLRARDILDRREPFALASSYNLNYDLAAERKEAASWLRVKFKLPTDTDLSGPGALASDARFRRGTEFWQLGMYDEARIEFEDLRQSAQENAADTFRLGNYMLDLGLYRPAIEALRQVLTLAGLNNQAASLNAPLYFKHARYGLYYADLVWPAAAENGLDPIFVTSLIRQESLFEGFASSSASAYGLMQIIPSTGADIATKMGWPPDYTQNDLYSPYISIRMGTYYFSATRSQLDGDLYAALAGYNGGPGFAITWKDISNGDPDLFLEVTRKSETREYIRSIYEIYSLYRSIYSPMQ